MATKKPRITITLTDHQHAIFRTLSAANGQSMSGIICEFIEASEPVFERMAAIASQLRKQRTSELDRMRFNLDKAQNELEPLAAVVLDQLDMFFKSLDASPDSPDPRPVITGVTPPKPKPLKAFAGKVSKPIQAHADTNGVPPAFKVVKK